MVLWGLTARPQVLISLIFGNKLNTPALEFGLEGGGNWSLISKMDSRTYLSEWNLGFYFDIRLKNKWYLYTGVLVKSRIGLSDLTDKDLENLNVVKIPVSGKYEQRINYFMVPLLIKYRFPSRFFLAAGPHLALRSKAWVNFEKSEGDIEYDIRQFNSDNISKIDAGVMGAMGYKIGRRISSLSIAVKYYYGLVDVYKNIPGSKNSALFLVVDVPIGAGIKAKNKNIASKEKKEIKKSVKAAKKYEKEKEKAKKKEGKG